MLRRASAISIDESLVQEEFVRAPGPGGQNVNKVATAVQLRYDAARAPMSDDTRRRLKLLAGTAMTKDGTLIIQANRYRSQAQNRADARARLLVLLRKAAIRPRARIATAPTFAARERRLQDKKLRAALKRERRISDSC
jgi:ribosome-associated protein